MLCRHGTWLTAGGNKKEERTKIPYTRYTYECDEFIDAMQIADQLGLPYEKVYKTLVTRGARDYYVFVIPIHRELNLKAAAHSVGEKSVEMILPAIIISGGCIGSQIELAPGNLLSAARPSMRI